MGVETMRRTFLTFLVVICLTLSLPTAAASFSTARAGMKYKGVVYRVGSKSTKWKTRLGNYTRKVQETSGSLTSYTYTFKKRGVRVTTLYSSKLKKEKITSILIVGKSVTTAGGLKIGQGYSKMKGMYGKKFTRAGSVFTYKAGSRRLQIKASGGRIAAIKIS
jgi:hypothetical protein